MRAKTKSKNKRPFFKGRGKEGLDSVRQYFAAVHGRPFQNAPLVPRESRSLRLPLAAWNELERMAFEQGITSATLVRKIIAELLYKSESPSPKVKVEKKRARKAA